MVAFSRIAGVVALAAADRSLAGLRGAQNNCPDGFTFDQNTQSCTQTQTSGKESSTKTSSSSTSSSSSQQQASGSTQTKEKTVTNADGTVGFTQNSKNETAQASNSSQASQASVFNTTVQESELFINGTVVTSKDGNSSFSTASSQSASQWSSNNYQANYRSWNKTTVVVPPAEDDVNVVVGVIGYTEIEVVYNQVSKLGPLSLPCGWTPYNSDVALKGAALSAEVTIGVAFSVDIQANFVKAVEAKTFTQVISIKVEKMEVCTPLMTVAYSAEHKANYCQLQGITNQVTVTAGVRCKWVTKVTTVESVQETEYKLVPYQNGMELDGYEVVQENEGVQANFAAEALNVNVYNDVVMACGSTYGVAGENPGLNMVLYNDAKVLAQPQEYKPECGYRFDSNVQIVQTTPKNAFLSFGAKIEVSAKFWFQNVFQFEKEPETNAGAPWAAGVAQTKVALEQSSYVVPTACPRKPQPIAGYVVSESVTEDDCLCGGQH